MQTYLVGGAVRDKLLGYPFHERDWVVVGGSPEQMEQQGFRAVGTSLILDIDAPRNFRIEDPINGTPDVDDTNNLVPRETAVTGVVGIDHEVLLVQNELVDFIPYFDTNYHLAGSPGRQYGNR